jgi:phospholipid N-methyltransferase
MMDACFSSDRASFLRAWLKEPLKVASVTPSTQSLGRLITSEIKGNTGFVLELGGGTGVFTRALMNRGVLEEHITVIERNPTFIAMLKERFPKAQILYIDASRAGRSDYPASRKFAATISGLPMLSMSPREIMATLTSSFRNMPIQGRFYQFTYGLRCPVPRPILDRLGLKAIRIGRTSWNFPPASVYRISQRNTGFMNSFRDDASLSPLPRPS